MNSVYMDVSIKGYTPRIYADTNESTDIGRHPVNATLADFQVSLRTWKPEIIKNQSTPPGYIYDSLFSSCCFYCNLLTI